MAGVSRGAVEEAAVEHHPRRRPLETTIDRYDVISASRAESSFRQRQGPRVTVDVDLDAQALGELGASGDVAPRRDVER